MTVTPLFPTRPCTKCGHRYQLAKGAVLKHEKACRGPAPALAGVRTEEHARLIVRAGAHAVAPEDLSLLSRFLPPVTDLDMARVLRALEGGLEIVQGKRVGGWIAPDGSPLGRTGRLSATVNEGIRVGLLHQQTTRTGPATWLTRVIPAVVHLRSAKELDLPACATPSFTFRRYRLMNADDLQYVDCASCLGRA